VLIGLGLAYRNYLAQAHYDGVASAEETRANTTSPLARPLNAIMLVNPARSKYLKIK
jgi:hypothetical protein